MAEILYMTLLPSSTPPHLPIPLAPPPPHNKNQLHVTNPRTDAFAAAPSCRSLPTATASKPDKAGRLWGQLNSGSSGSGGGSSSGSGSTAACAFKDAQGHALFYAGYEPGSWLHTPACRMTAFSANSVTDSKLRVSCLGVGGGLMSASSREHWHQVAETVYTSCSKSHPPQLLVLSHLPPDSVFPPHRTTNTPHPTTHHFTTNKHTCQTWGWEQQSGSLCAFKDDQQLPIPQQQTYTMLSWSEAPACLEQPQPTADNAVPDKFGCLWGWQLNRNCAYRDAATGQPVYFSGYSGKCDVAGSVRRAAEWNASKEFARDPTPSGPGGVTGMGCIGQVRWSAARGLRY